MQSRTIALLAGVAVLAVLGTVAVRGARAQAAGMLCCDPAGSQSCAVITSGKCPSTVAVQLNFPNAAPNVGVVKQEQEGAGFQGACLVANPTLHAPQLPYVCYHPSGVRYSTGIHGELVVPAQTVFRSYWSLPPQYDSFQGVMTCYPKNSDGTWPQNCQPISNSCCGAATNMTCTDNVFANGGRGYPGSWDGYFAHGTVDFAP